MTSSRDLGINYRIIDSEWPGNSRYIKERLRCEDICQVLQKSNLVRFKF